MPRKRTTYKIGGELLTKPEYLENWCLIIRCEHQRGQDQENCLAELDRRGLWLTEEQKIRAGLACAWPSMVESSPSSVSPG